MNNKVKLGIITSVILALCVLGVTLYSNWQIEKAEEAKIIKVIERNLAADDQKIFEDRAKDLEQKLQTEQDNAIKYNYYLDLGTYKYSLGLLQESKDYLDKALEIKADQYDVYLRLFNTQVDMQDYSGAEASIKKAISIRKGSADFWRRYILLKTERMNASNDEITGLYEEALKNVSQNGDVPNNIDIYTSYATWLEKANDPAKAIEYWRKAIDTNPEKRNIYQAEIDRIQKLIK